MPFKLPSIKTLLFVMTLLLVSACASKGPVVHESPPELKPAPPAAWVMEHKSTSLKQLDWLFSISEKPSSETRPPLKPAKPTSEK